MRAADEKTSLDEQERACRKYAARHGWEVLEVFADEVSGKYGLAERPSGRRLLDALAGMPPGSEVVTIVAKLDRLARSVVKGLGDIETLTDKVRGRKLVILNTPLGEMDTTTPEGELMLTNLLAFAQYERRLIAARMETGRAGKARRGGWSGGMPPLGFTTDEKGALVIDEEEASTIRRMFALTVSESLSPAQVTDTLKAEGRTTKGGGAWRHTQILEALARPIYSGGGITKTHGGETFTIEAPALVDSEVFEAAAKILASRKRKTSGGNQGNEGKPRGWKYGLAGRIFHDHDGTLVKMFGETAKGLRRYRCSERPACAGFGRRMGSVVKSIEARLIETSSLEAVLGMLDDPERLAEYQATYDAEAVAEYGGETAVHRMRAKVGELADLIGIEAKATFRSELLAGASDADAQKAAEAAVDILKAEQSETRAAIARAEDREAQRLSVKVTIDELMNATIGTQGPEGIDPTTELDEARSDLRYEIRNVAAAIQGGDRSPDLSEAAVAWLKVLVDKLDLNAIIESGGPEGWTLRSSDSTTPSAAIIANGTGTPRQSSANRQGGRATPSSIRFFPTGLLAQIGWPSTPAWKRGMTLPRSMVTKEATSTGSSTSWIGSPTWAVMPSTSIPSSSRLRTIAITLMTTSGSIHSSEETRHSTSC